MAYDFEDGSNQKIVFASHADYTTTVDISFWVKAESNPGTHQTIHVSKTRSGYDRPNFSLLWTPAGGGDVYTVAYAGGGFNEWKADYSATTGVWEHWYFSINWSTNPDTHLFWANAVSKTMTHNYGSNNVTPDVTATQEYSIGMPGSGTNNTDGILAEIAVWSDNNSALRLNALSKGASPLFFLENLNEYFPLIRELQNPVGGGVGTLTNTPVVANHPRMIYPSGFQLTPYYASGAPSSSIKTIDGLSFSFTKTINGLAIASVKTVNGLA